MLVLPGAYDSLENYSDDLSTFIDSPLVRQITGGIHVNDALICDAWNNLPSDWTQWWLSQSDYRLVQQDLIDSVDDKSHHAMDIRPSSLTNWLNTMRSLALPRDQRAGSSITLPGVLIARMKTKKIAEISRAVAYVYDQCKRKSITHIVEMGSGQGYLSVSLAYLFPNLRILAIDGSESQIEGSRAFAASLGIPEHRLEHMFAWIDMSSSLADKVNEWIGGNKCMLVGLHACGSLSEHILRYFTTMSSIKALAVVGCCFNHIVPLSPTCPEGFPISLAMRKRNVILSPTALMTGCQAPGNWTRPDLSNNKSIYSKRRLYRAVLEKLFHDKGIEVGDAGKRPVWGIRKGDLDSFTAYAHRAMDCLGIDGDRVSIAELESYEELYKDYEGHIAILWTLSIICSKVVESVIAIDRYLFLVEQGMKGVDVIPIFDFKISPRNLMIVAEKGETR
ncbi:CRA-b-like protein, protein [Acrodontium crateriforme]|uniref:CRA-b-like protein, protein n=1 Tax=Acrodontium crateriforme TaxID=150365 RepID=A0AAQ3MCK6_9PEZI|nr:CRA-b-like protein, protein [Acrodontium crateriforme]